MRIVLRMFFAFGLLLSVNLTLQAQDKMVTGRVIAADDGAAIPGVNVVVKGSTTGTTTGADGRYSISVPDNATLVFSFIGLQAQEVAVGNRTTIDISMTSDVKQLGEVVVVGYGTTRREEITGSVATVSAAAIDQVPIASFDNILQGKATGVQVTGVNGRPGNNAFVRIRGVGSITAGSAPLYVVNGVPISVENFNAINPNDIESLTVLKDAAATSIYGSRGSNGVIVITTKQGKAREPLFQYRFQSGIKRKTPDNFKMMTAAEKLRYEYELEYENPNISAILADGTYSADNIFDVTDAERQGIWKQLTDKEVDWRDILLRDGKLQSHEISLSGSGDRFNYYFSLNRYQEEGVLLGSSFNRTGGSLNLEYKANNWLKVGNSLTTNFTKSQDQRDRFNAQNAFYAAYSYNPYEQPYLPDGSFNVDLSSGFPILEAIENNPESLNKFAAIGSLYGEATFLKDFRFRTTLGLNFINRKREYYVKPGSILDQYVGDKAAPGSKTDNGSDDFTYVWTNQLSWDKSFGLHNISASALTEYNENVFTSYSLSKKGFPTASVSTQNNASTPTAASTFREEWALYSVFGRVNYNFNKKYYVDANLRRDGSSRFGANNKYGTFWAIGGAWNVTNEAFLANNTIINSLRLRGSVGTSGNFDIGNYASLGLYGFGNYNGQPTSQPTQLPNDNLTWERNLNYGIGTDFELLKGRIFGTVDYYHRTTKDLLLSVPVSGATGFTSRLENVGEMVNKGIEALLGYYIVRNDRMSWSVSASLTRNQNEITKLYGEGADIPQTLSRLSVGQPINTFFLVRSAGIDRETGEPQYLDKEGNIVKTYSSGDAVLLEGKAPDPRWYGNFNTTFSFKGIGVSADLYYSGGNYTMNNNYQVLNSDGENVIYNQAAEALDYWRPDNKDAKNPAPQFITYDTDRYLQKGDFLRLRNVLVSYSLPQNLLSKIRSKGLRVYLQGQNLFTRTQFFGDPEVGIGSGESADQLSSRAGLGTLFSYPQTKAYTFGLDITF